MSFDIINFTLLIINLFTLLLGYAILIRGVRISREAKNLLNDTQRLLMLYSSRRRNK